MKSKTGKRKEDKEVRAEGQPKLSKKVLKNDSEKMHVQYPAQVGYHGTDEEKELNPEE